MTYIARRRAVRRLYLGFGEFCSNCRYLIIEWSHGFIIFWLQPEFKLQMQLLVKQYYS